MFCTKGRARLDLSPGSSDCYHQVEENVPVGSFHTGRFGSPGGPASRARHRANLPHSNVNGANGLTGTADNKQPHY